MLRPDTYAISNLTCAKQIPIGGWPKDPAMAQIGRFVQQTLENDLEGEQA